MVDDPRDTRRAGDNGIPSVKTNKQPRKELLIETKSNSSIKPGEDISKPGAASNIVADNTAWLDEPLDMLCECVIELRNALKDGDYTHAQFIEEYNEAQAEFKQAILSYIGEHKVADSQDSASESQPVNNQADASSVLAESSLDNLLHNIRDAGAIDDNNGAEDWTFSDKQIDRAKRIIRQYMNSAPLPEAPSKQKEVR